MKEEGVVEVEKITVKLFASLARYKPSHIDAGSPIEIMMTPGATVEEVIFEMGLPQDKVRTITVNEGIVKVDSQLYDGDVLTLFPSIAGG